MRVFFLVAARQIRRQLSRWSVWASMAVLALAAGLATTIGLRAYAVDFTRYTQFLQQVVEAQAHSPGLAMGWQVESALRIVRPPSPAVAVIRGVSASSPAYWDFGPGGSLPVTPVPLHDADDVSPMVDIEFVIRVLVGLLALVLATDALSRVQKEGELDGLANLPVSQWQIWTGQCAGSAVVAFAAAGVVAAVATVTVMFSAEDPATRQSVIVAVARLAGPTVGYLGFMVSVGSAIAALCSSAAARALVVLAAWLTVSVFAPTTLLSIARVLRSVPSASDMTTSRDTALTAELRAGEIEMGDALVKRAQTESIVDVFDAGRYPELEPIWAAHTFEARRRATEIENEWHRQARARDGWVNRMEWFSPASLFWRAGADAAGTGRSQQRAWEAAASAYSEILRATLFDNRPRVNVRLPSDRGRQMLVMIRHPVPLIRNLPAFVESQVEATPTGEVARPVATLWLYAILITSLSTAWSVRRRS